MLISNNGNRIKFGISCSNWQLKLNEYKSIPEKLKLIEEILRRTKEFIDEGDKFISQQADSSYDKTKAVKNYEAAVGNLRFLKYLIDQVITKLEEKIKLLEDK